MTDYIGVYDVAKLAGVSLTTIINHEREGLLPSAERLGVRRVYSPEAARAVVVHFAKRKKWSSLTKV